MLCLAVFLPIVAGLLLLAFPPKSRGMREFLVEGVTIVTSLLAAYCLMNRQAEPTIVVYLMKDMPMAFLSSWQSSSPSGPRFLGNPRKADQRPGVRNLLTLILLSVANFMVWLAECW